MDSLAYHIDFCVNHYAMVKFYSIFYSYFHSIANFKILGIYYHQYFFREQLNILRRWLTPWFVWIFPMRDIFIGLVLFCSLFDFGVFFSHPPFLAILETHVFHSNVLLQVACVGKGRFAQCASERGVILYKKCCLKHGKEAFESKAFPRLSKTLLFLFSVPEWGEKF